MRTLSKCCLLAAALGFSASSMALQALNDDDMSSSTAQDGIDITMSNLSVGVDYMRYGSSGNQTSSYSGAADLQMAGFAVKALSPIDLQMRVGSNSSGRAAIVLNLSPMRLQFNPMTMSVHSWSGQQSALVAGSDQQAVAGSGMFTINMGTVTLPSLSMTVTQGMTDHANGTQVSSSGITLGTSAISKIDIAGLGIQTTPAEQARGNNAYLFHAQDIAFNNIGPMTMSIGALSGAAATQAGLTGNAASNGALWISTSPVMVGSVQISNMGMGDASSQIGNLSLSNLKIGAVNTYISAVR